MAVIQVAVAAEDMVAIIWSRMMIMAWKAIHHAGAMVAAITTMMKIVTAAEQEEAITVEAPMGMMKIPILTTTVGMKGEGHVAHVLQDQEGRAGNL